jgi:cellulose synthase/poly-beta-1,6-N-acetylglucosamine synthase-like glycosyltransferase
VILVLAIALGLLVYVHAGFPALLALFAARARARRPVALPVVRDDPWRPRASVLVAAWNEEAVIAAKIDNALAQDYPEARLEVVVVSDGSTDRTHEIVASRLGPRVRLVALPERGGKARAIRHAAAVARGEVLVLTDANAFFARDAVRRLVDRLEPEDVSCAFGDVKIRPEGCPYAASEGLFYRLERRIQKDESDLDSAVGVDGALYAIRREAFTPPPDGSILDDLEIAIEATRDGRRVVYEPRAVAFEDATPTLAQEVRRKSRIVAGAVQALRAGRMTPDADRGWLWFAFVGHKLLRWAAPVFLIALFLASILTPGPVGWLATIAQVAFYGAALAGLLLHRRVALGTLSVPLYFTAMHAAALMGLGRGLLGRQPATWARADRRPVAGSLPDAG